MNTQSRTVRVFLSSTFRDFAEERDLLVRKVFPELRRKCREREVELVDVDLRWGITEEEAQQGKVLPICLAEIDRSRPFFMGFIGERYGWVPEKNQYDISLLLEQSWLDEHRGGKSVTELEMLHGVLNNPAMEDRAFFYFRDSAYSQAKGGTYLSEGPRENAKLEALKDRIRQSGFPVVENYRSPEELAERVRVDLWKVINEAFPESDVPDALAQERMRHDAYSAARRRLYLGGEKYFQFLDAAMKAKAFKPVLVSGQSGGGKSSLFANWTARRSKTHPKTALILHHLGCGADAADPVRMATRIMQQIARITGDEFKPDSDPDKVLEKLPESLAIASAWAEREERELLLVLDGLEKVSDRQHLRWFPAHVPPRVKLLASCLDGEVLEAAKRRLDWSELKVKPFTRTEQTRFIKEYLGRYRKSLTTPQRKSLQSHPLCGNPLFLLTVLEELRVFGVHEKLQERLQVLLSPPASKGKDEEPTVDDVFEHVLGRIEEDLGKKPVQTALEAIWASRSGLFQEELLSIASLAPAQWAAIQIALDESLYDGGGKINFGHYYLSKAVEDHYGLTGKVKNELHKKIAEWFAEKKVDFRVAEELPWQWRESNNLQNLQECLLRKDLFQALHLRSAHELLGYWISCDSDAIENNERPIETAYKNAWDQWSQVNECEKDEFLLVQLSSFLKLCGCYGPFAYRLHELAMECSKQHGDTNFRFVTSAKNFALFLEQRGDYSKSEGIYRKLVESQERILGADHIETLRTLGSLGNHLRKRKEYPDAKEIYERLLPHTDKQFGPEHPETLRCKSGLGRLLSETGELDAAEGIFKSIFEKQKTALGIDHPDTLQTAESISNLSKRKKDYENAELYLQFAFSGKQKTKGIIHPSTIVCAVNLGSLWAERGEFEKATDIYWRAINHAENVMGTVHPFTLSIVNNFGTIMKLKKDYDGAESLFQSALKHREPILGKEHRETLQTVVNLAKIFRSKGDPQSMIRLLRVWGQKSEKFANALRLHKKINPESRDEVFASVNLKAIENYISY
jgi:nephrocystin-3